jgi:hydroxyacylglutathione hydrolase
MTIHTDEVTPDPEADRGSMTLKQYYLGSLAQASYLIADEESGEAAVVDPQRDVGQYLEDAARLGCTITHVFLTHFHADFLAGHLELRERVGASIHLGARARAEYPFVAMRDGATVTLGAVRLVVLETPGHSPESISILVSDPEQGDEPYAALTGDTLLIGDVGRPDLRGSLGWSADRLADMLYDSLHTKLARLPDDTLVYPAHGAGSLCARNLSSETVSTVGAQRAANYALRPMSRRRFREMVTRDLPDAPPYFTFTAFLNSRERATIEQSLEQALRPLSLDQVVASSTGGVQLLDTRDATEFQDGHLPGSINIGLGGSYETWSGTIVDPHRPIVLIASPDREVEAATRLGRIGFDSVAGYLSGGIEGPAEGTHTLDRIERVTAETLTAWLGSAEPPFLLDVRTATEWRQARIEHAVHIPLSRLAERLDEVPTDRPIVVYCATGYRSAIAASMLRRQGFTRVADLAGGFSGANGQWVAPSWGSAPAPSSASRHSRG